MKKIIIFLGAILVISTQTAFASPYTSTIDKIENSLFGFTYSNETETTRLNRIEEKVYGKTSTAQTQNRVAKLKKDLAADLMGQEIEPKEDTFAEEEDSWVTAKEPAEAAKMDYPVINELERQVFNKEFKDQNIKTRLSNLESKTFGKTYDKEDLSTRVDRLRAEIRPQRFMDNKMAKQENSFLNDPIDPMSKNYHLNQYGTPNFNYDAYNRRNKMSYQDDFGDNFGDDSNFFSSSPNVFKQDKTMSLSKIEKVLYKTKYENEPTAQRLSRIESSVFGTNFASDSDSVRMERISSAINAQKSAKKYDSNRFGQNMATAFQIGTIILMVLACIL